MVPDDDLVDMPGGVRSGDAVMAQVPHPLRRYSVMAVVSAPRRLSVVDYSHLLRHADVDEVDAPKLLDTMAAEHDDVVSVAWDKHHRRMLVLSRKPGTHSEIALSVHAYKSMQGWEHLLSAVTRLKAKERTLFCMFVHKKPRRSTKLKCAQGQAKGKGKSKGSLLIVAQESEWKAFRIDLDAIQSAHRPRPQITTQRSQNQRKSAAASKELAR